MASGSAALIQRSSMVPCEHRYGGRSRVGSAARPTWLELEHGMPGGRTCGVFEYVGQPQHAGHQPAQRLTPDVWCEDFLVERHGFVTLELHRVDWLLPLAVSQGSLAQGAQVADPVDVAEGALYPAPAADRDYCDGRGARLAGLPTPHGQQSVGAQWDPVARQPRDDRIEGAHERRNTGTARRGFWSRLGDAVEVRFHLVSPVQSIIRWRQDSMSINHLLESLGPGQAWRRCPATVAAASAPGLS